MSGRFVMLFSLLVPVLSFTATPAYAQKFSCGSNNNQYQMCQIPGNGNPQNVRMVRQLGQAACIQGRTWGTRGNQVWVDKGCRAEFQVAGVTLQMKVLDQQESESSLRLLLSAPANSHQTIFLRVNDPKIHLRIDGAEASADLSRLRIEFPSGTGYVEKP